MMNGLARAHIMQKPASQAMPDMTSKFGGVSIGGQNSKDEPTDPHKLPIRASGQFYN